MMRVMGSAVEELFWQLWTETKVPRWALKEVFGDYVEIPYFVDDRFIPTKEVQKMLKESHEQIASVKEADIYTVTVKDLSDEYGLAAREIRSLLRGAGFSANQADSSSRPKYEWKSDSPELDKIKEIIKGFIKKNF